ncbi:MAG: hypothetical protein BWZ09_02197 [Alphaproteobacteria bacterium ADurb.BinA305]|nr:MAG: hypothetical protein BWZ09_02197 [Alphaproteobacteria bacterium ADurb.BinA305]
MGDDDLARLPGRQHPALAIDDLDNEVLGSEVHAALRALVGDEAGVAGAVAVGDRAAEDTLDGLALVVVEALGGAERHLDAEVVHANPAPFGVQADMGQRRRVAEDHLRAARADAGDEAVQLRGGHLEGGQQLGTEQPIPQCAHPVLRAELDRRAPHDNLGIADVDAPPARRAPLGGDVVAHTPVADEEDERLAARAAGVEASQSDRVVGLQGFGIGADLRLAQEGQALQLGQAGDRRGVEADAREAFAVIGHVVARMHQQRTQALELQGLDALARPPLAILQAAPQGDAVVLLEALVEREKQARDQAGVEAGHFVFLRLKGSRCDPAWPAGARPSRVRSLQARRSCRRARPDPAAHAA